MSSEKLPRGIWFEETRQRYRVRKYRNGHTRLAGYFETLDGALEGLKRLNAKLAKEPKLKRGEKEKGQVPKATFAGLARAIVKH